VGPIQVVLDPDPAVSAVVESMEIRDSIVDATQAPAVDGRRIAISNVNGAVTLSRVTVLGDVHAELLTASDSIVTGLLVIANAQESCFRFSATSRGDGERVPKLFHVPALGPSLGQIEPFFFTSLRFGDPGYAQLSLAAPQEVLRGAENSSEMGAFGSLLAPVRLDNVIAKIDEFKPIGVVAQIVRENEEAAGQVDTGE
jgi:hypothetical protein